MQRFTRFLAANLVLLAAACGTEEAPLEPQGLTVLQLEPATLKAVFVDGDSRLSLSSEVHADEIVSTVNDGRGVVTTLRLPATDRRSANDLRRAVEDAAAASLDALQPVARQDARPTVLMAGYVKAIQALHAELPNDPANKLLLEALLMQPSVLTTAFLHIRPASIQPAHGPKEMNIELPPGDGGGGYEEPACPDCAPNDDVADYNATPVYQVIYDDAGSGGPSGEMSSSGSVREQKIDVYGRGCFGACGPGCDWCVRVNSSYFCYTNQFCQWHDAHCGAWEHFFDCRW